jgi:hypothetical protein
MILLFLLILVISFTSLILTFDFSLKMELCSILKHLSFLNDEAVRVKNFRGLAPNYKNASISTYNFAKSL